MPNRDRMMLGKQNLKAMYARWVSKSKQTMDRDSAMHHAIGGEFEAFGVVEREMLRFYGLKEQDYLIDVGCGSGRLAKPLSEYLRGRYLGTDLVDDLVVYARELVQRPAWRFEVVDGLTIPERDGEADMVCFFSVFTHLLPEQTYLYLEEARRVLRPGGKIVFSFLEFAEESHWYVFQGTVNNARGDNEHPLNVFLDRTGITAFAQHLDLRVEEFRGGLDRFVPLPHAITLDSGELLSDYGNLGQSICVLSRPA